ncbi:TlpA family protein disulfide reductase [Paenibacillus sp. SYP-B3998]|uniref:TlpA family protein disulfide reductase n=1 Tax=Paenibacillus sp. SYP-B3998 TaxID=2678564 RepID=A0A6G4A2J7_9BACL|nr:TlpA disulfide reductase family protein [Paenibacillus sp. SYP-B3998]NEW08605.1 TlpA family protein disulfide reductase [Paenibacillus sp. SYP-B3998]
MKRQYLLLIIVVILVILAIYQNKPINKEELPTVGYQAPSISLTGLDGNPYTLEELGDKPIVVNFWASWCGPCKLEAPELVRLYGKYKDEIEIYAVNVTTSDTIEDAQDFAEEYGINFPILLDVDGEVSRKYQIKPIPTTFFINKDGVIMEKLYGVADPSSLENKFKQLLQ